MKPDLPSPRRDMPTDTPSPGFLGSGPGVRIGLALTVVVALWAALAWAVAA